MPLPDFDSILDRLYSVPLSEFVAVRNEAAKALKAEGQKDEAATVQRLRKPSIAAWTVNQLRFSAPEELRALAEATRGLADAHSSPGADLPEAIRSRRKQLDHLLERSRELWEAHGVRSTKDQLRRLSGTLEAATQPGADPPPGRLFTDLEPAGFGALAGLQLAVPAPSSPPTKGRSERAGAKKPRGRGESVRVTRTADGPEPPTRKPTSQRPRPKPEDPASEDDPSPRALAAAERALGAATARLERLERLVDRAEADAAAARRRVDRDRAKLADLEARVEHARTAVEEAVARAEAKERAFAEQQQDRDSARNVVKEAKAALEALQGQ
ncbi:MAG: hypothetical protein HKO53_04305 [Gemmatimonadetes bacterium]|nr:hypothetical protein [Gemmatimonadota bacterium]